MKPFLKIEQSGDRTNAGSPSISSDKFAATASSRGPIALSPGHLLCLFLKIQFLESVARDDLFDRYPPARIHVCRKRIKCAKNGDFSAVKSSPTCYAWFVWQKGFHEGKTIIDRI